LLGHGIHKIRAFSVVKNSNLIMVLDRIWISSAEMGFPCCEIVAHLQFTSDIQCVREK